MEEKNIDLDVKNEIINDMVTLLVENEVKQEQEDVPEYVNINSFSDVKVPTDVCEIDRVWYQCTQCPTKYRKADYLIIHSAVHNPQRSCPICCEKFTCKKKLGLHLNQHIKDRMQEERKIAYKCDYCEKKFDTKKKIVLHTRVHTNERPHKCEICGEGFKQLGTLKVHYVTHTKERLFVCEICNGGFTTSSSLKRHKKRLHDKGKTLNCKYCGVKFLNMADFRAHRSDAHPETAFKRTCPICSEVFHSKTPYRKHKQSHEDQSPNAKKNANGKCYFCILCGNKSHMLSQYLEHGRLHINYSKSELEEAMINNLFKCKLCTKEFTIRSAFFKHTDIHMEKKFKCKLCENFYSYFGLKVHMRGTHQILRCHLCHKEVLGRTSLNYHYSKQHPSLKKKFGCSICGRQYMQKHALSVHYKLIHEKNAVKNFKCNVCGKRYLTRLILAGHMSHHTRIADNKGSELQTKNKQSHSKNRSSKTWGGKSRRCFQCKVCKKIFQSDTNYINHVTLKTCVSFLENLKTEFKCSICFKTLGSRESLKGHMELHSNALYKCRFCGKRFKQFGVIRRHLRKIHPGEQVFWCDACSEGFNNVYYFKKHVNLHELKGDGVIDFEKCTDSVLGVSCGYIMEEGVEESTDT